MGYLAQAFHILLTSFASQDAMLHTIIFPKFFSEISGSCHRISGLRCDCLSGCLSSRPCPRRWSSSDSFYCCTVGRAWNQHGSLRCAFEDPASNKVTWHFRPRLFAGAIGNTPLTILQKNHSMIFDDIFSFFPLMGKNLDFRFVGLHCMTRGILSEIWFFEI